MTLFLCCCGWQFIVGRRQVYGPIYAMGIGDYPSALAPTQHMMTRAEWADSYADCSACLSGVHHHDRDRVT